MATDIFEGLDEIEEAPQPDLPEAKSEPAPELTPEPDKAARAPEPDKPAKPEPARDTSRDNEPKTIPLASHLEERNKHRSELEQERAARRALEARLAKLESPPPPKPELPEFTADPKGYVDHRFNAAMEQLETGTKTAKQTADQAAATADEARFMHALSTSEQTFVSQTPDYYDALNHIRTLREAELTTLHPEVPIAEIRKFMGQEELQLAANLLRSNRNPSEVAYTLAKARGYVRKEAPAANVASILPPLPKPNQLPPDQTLGTGAGSPDVGEPSLNDDEVFDKAFNEMFPRKRA